MSSIIQGYSYDIFISYRQNDNKHDGWVTEFVNQLKAELESTIKEEISIYFDINPHDGLLETHDVDDSLKEKLKCLVFIPIISLTYCDSKSFAWEHEFKVFVDQASKDIFGLKVKLPNGNVASRVLPVRIHDLDSEDVNSFEGVIGGVMRTLDFVFKTASGVNRPLKSKEDHPGDNLNKTYYQDQINKVALAIKEIIFGLKREPDPSTKMKAQIKESLEEEKKDDIRGNPISRSIFNKKSKKWSIILLSILLCVLGTFAVLKIIEGKKEAEDISKLEKSIAVLPFVNDSPDQDNAYFINGIMAEILNNLQKINDFRVLSRTSTEQYRGSNKPAIPKIAKELDVNYIVEGSGQKYGNKFVLRVQLIAANDEKHLWGESFEQEIRETSDIINLQSQIAQKIAVELKATITPEEKQLIEKKSTSSLIAYDLYQRGREEYEIHWGDSKDLKRAEYLFQESLKQDSKFAPAYAGLAQIYWDKHYMEEYFNSKFMDSALLLCNIALSFDNQLAEAYYIRGEYYNAINKPEQAFEEYDKSIRLNPNYWWAYLGKGWNYFTYDLDYVYAIDNLQKAISLNHGTLLPLIITLTSYAYLKAGFIEKAKYYCEEAFRLDGDTVRNLYLLSDIVYASGNNENAIKYLQKAYALDSNNHDVLLGLGSCYSNIHQPEEALKYLKRLEKTQSLESLTNYLNIFGYAYWQNGNKNRAEYYFNKQIEFSNMEVKLGRTRINHTQKYWNLASVHAIRGEKKKAYEYLEVINKNQILSLWDVTFFRQDPKFNSIRNEPEFQNIVREVEAKYQAEHERVKKWLEEKGNL